MSEAKPFCISKREVWDAYQRVKGNKGAAGIDDQSIEDFEKKLKKNLYKIWNRMSSGTYFPPPVRTVKIAKKNGGERKLGIPTVADRIAQQVVKARLEPEVEPLFHADSYGYRPGSRHWTQWVKREKDAGVMTGFSIWISGASLTAFHKTYYFGQSGSMPRSGGSFSTSSVG